MKPKTRDLKERAISPKPQEKKHFLFVFKALKSGFVIVFPFSPSQCKQTSHKSPCEGNAERINSPSKFACAHKPKAFE